MASVLSDAGLLLSDCDDSSEEDVDVYDIVDLDDSESLEIDDSSESSRRYCGFGC